MDTTVVWFCLKKFTKLGFSVAALLLLVACPGEDMDCNDFGSIAEVPELINLTPEQTYYNRGDEMILKLEIPAVNNYFGTERDIFNVTGDENARLVLGFEQLFIDNTLIFLKGSQGEFPNWFEMPYNPITQTYEFELKIILNRVGFYSFFTGDSIELNGSDYCNRFRIDTNVIWNYTNGKIEFTVNE